MTGLRILPAAGTKPRALIMLLHGVGGDAATMEPSAQVLRGTLIDTAIVVPDAPSHFDLGPYGYQWFSVDGVTNTNRDARIQNAIPVVEDLIEQEAMLLGLTHDRVGVCGFSQGAMIALTLADRPNAPRFIASIAGRITRLPRLRANPLPQIFLSQGTADQTVPYACLNEAVTAFKHANFPLTALTIERQGHFISPRQARAVADFFARAF